MTPLEKRASIGLAGIFGLRMLGMFLILPVFAIYAQSLPGGDNHTLIGLALGAYGLTQALLQLPFGMASDHFGRKRMIYVGLIVFAAGSFLAAIATNIYVVILGRAVQGAGAISAAVMALAADLTREEHRTKAMALIGSTIGVTFAASLALGPALYRFIGVPGIFAMTGILALTAIAVVRFGIPDPQESVFHSDTEASTARLRDVLRDAQLLRLNFGIFALHAMQMAMFVVIPFALVETSGLTANHHWQVYLPVVIAAFVIMVPGIIYGEKKGKLKEVFVAAVGLLFLVQVSLTELRHHYWGIILALLGFFTAFNLLEASLPSIISKVAPARAKGTAIGVYNTCQALGLFTGGLLGGFFAEHFGYLAVFLFTSALALAWLALAVTMKTPPAVRSKMYHIALMTQGQAAELQRNLSALAGVREAMVLPEEGAAYLKVNMDAWDEQGALKLIGGN